MCAAWDEDDSGSLCVREPDHQGACANQSGYVFADAGRVGTFADSPEDARTFSDVEQGHLPTTDVGSLVAVLDRVLSRRWDAREAATALSTADACFGRLDRQLRDGGDLPARWAAASNWGSPHDMVCAEVAYDGVSEELRTTGDAAACLRALRYAALNWRHLVGMLDHGGPLPSPWRRL